MVLNIAPTAPPIFVMLYLWHYLIFYEDILAFNYTKCADKSMHGTPKFETVMTIANILNSIRSPSDLPKSTDIDYSGKEFLSIKICCSMRIL